MMSTRPPFGLHLGLPRTGTKTLQWQLFSRHPQIHYIGLWHRPPGASRRRPPHRYRDRAAHEFFESQLFERGTDLAELRRHWQALQAEADSDKVIAWSKETLSRGPLSTRRASAEVIWRLFRPCRVILTLREPVDHLESVYRQTVRQKVVRRHAQKPSLSSIDAWLEDPEEAPFAKIFDHAETVRCYRDLFGAESVKVMLFEKLKEDPQRFFADVCEHFGVDPEVGADLYADRVDNARLTDRQVRLARWLLRRPILWRVVQRLPPGLRAHFLFGPPRRTGRSSDTLSEAHAERVRELSRPTNRWLREELGLQVEKYGYVV